VVLSIADETYTGASEKELELKSVEGIDQSIRSNCRPVLVEFYADFGFS
jgi:hypothetical protein